MNHPRRAPRDPLEGAVPTARQSRFRGTAGVRNFMRSALGH